MVKVAICIKSVRFRSVPKISMSTTKKPACKVVFTAVIACVSLSSRALSTLPRGEMGYAVFMKPLKMMW